MLMYVYLHRYKSIEGYVNLTVKDFVLYYNFSPNRNKNRINERVYKTLQLMIDKEFIQYIGCYSNGGLASLAEVNCDMMFTVQVINCDKFWNPENRFTKILYTEIDTLRTKNVKAIDKVLNLYINIKKRMSSDANSMSAISYAFPSEATLSRECGYSVSSIKAYTDILCNIGMLYVKNFGSYMKLKKGKEVVTNSNNVYALEEEFLNDNTKEALRDYLKNNCGYIDGFFPFCDNLPKDNIDCIEKNNLYEPKTDDWGEHDPMDESKGEDYSLEDIVDMPVMSEVMAHPKVSVLPIDEPNNLVQADNIDTAITDPVKIITIKKEEQNREKPKDIEIQEYAETLYKQYGYVKSIFIAELSEKFPGLDDYEKYYDSAKKLHELSV